MNIAVVYSSRTGNTKAVGEAIATALGAPVFSVSDKPDLSSCEGIAFGYWVDRAMLMQRHENLWLVYLARRSSSLVP